MRRARSPVIRRWKRNTNSIASSANVIGSGASSHHSGNTRFLIVMAPSRALSIGHAGAVAHQHEAHQEAEHVADGLHQPGDARRHGGQDDVEPHMLAAPQAATAR